jgi:signal transduction histidine kinase
VKNQKKNPSDFMIRKSGVLIDKMNGEDIVALGASFQHSPMMLLVLEKSNIQTPKDLFQKSVMVTSDAKESADILAMLQSFKLDSTNVNFVPHSFNLDDLISGKVDAMACFISNEPLKLQKLGIPYKILYPKDYGFDFYEDILVTNNSFLKNNPTLVQNFYKATLKGWEYAYNNIEESSMIIYKKYNTQNKTLDDLIDEGRVLKTIAYDKKERIGTLEETKLIEMGSVFKLLGITTKEFESKGFIYEHNAPPIISFEFDNTLKISIAFIIFGSVIIAFIVFYYTNQLKGEILEKEIAKKEIEKKNIFLKNIIDTMENIVVVTDTISRQMIMGNHQFFEFIHMNTIEEFKGKYDCICEFFVQRDGYLQREMDGVNWTEYLVQNSDKVNKVIISYLGKEHLYFVHAKYLNEEKSAAMAVFTDITDMKALDDKVAYAQKSEALNEMISNIAHHWRQPLSLITTLASTMMVNFDLGIKNDDEMKIFLDKIIVTAQDISRMLDIFHQKMKSNDDDLNLITYDELESKIESYFEQRLRESGIILHISLEDEIKKENVLYLFLQVLKEIIQNSIDILENSDHETKIIFLNIKKVNEKIVFEVVDNGGGVCEENIGKIFEPYFTTYHQTQGKGLGLYMTQKILNSLPKSSITVQNKQFSYQDKLEFGLETIIKVGQ